MTHSVDYERHPRGAPMDETDISLRAHFTRMDEAKLRSYDPMWTDEEVVQWDGNFRSDGALMLVCCERDVEIDEYRRVLAEHLQLRGLAPSSTRDQV